MSYASSNWLSRFRSKYQPPDTVPEILSVWMNVVMEETGSDSVQVYFRSDTGQEATDRLLLFVDKSGYSFTPECVGCMSLYENCTNETARTNNLKIVPHCRRSRRQDASQVTVPLRYQEKTLGALILGSRQADCSSFLPDLHDIARQMVFHAKRLDIKQSIQTKFGMSLSLLGTSNSLEQVDHFVEKASMVSYPAMIIGETGVESDYVACALHLAGPRCDFPFVSARCSNLTKDNFDSYLPELLRKAHLGTLFLSGIEDLEPVLQERLSEITRSCILPWASASSNVPNPNVRLVVSVCLDPDELLKEKRLSLSILEQLDYLRVHISPLRERSEDLMPLIQSRLRQFSTYSTKSLSNDVRHLLLSYPWPGNVSELDRTLLRLSVLSDKEFITMGEVAAYLPKIKNFAENLARPVACSGNNLEKASRPPTPAAAVELARALIRNDVEAAGGLHPAVQKAVLYLAKHFQESISLRDLASRSNISHSHLSFLFQQTLGTPFKVFLTLLRLEKARNALLSHPYATITEVSEAVGFSDLTHFERCFKRYLGLRPKDLRRIAKNGIKDTQ